MKHKIILVAESGSDIPKALAQELGIVLVPMHVSMGEETFDDGAFPAEDVCGYYGRTGKLPTTSGSTIHDFQAVYDRIFQADPQAQVLHLAYSAVTTCSYHSSELALEQAPYRDRVRLVDTKQVSVGQCAVLCAAAAWLKEHPQATLDQAAAAAEEISARTRMCFIPRDLKYLRAGGRCSNAAALVGDLLHLHPCIEIVDGRLVAGKKYRGPAVKFARRLLREFIQKHDLDRERVYFICSPYMEDALRDVMEEEAAAMGFGQVTWVKTGCVITCHGGPGAFGVVGQVRGR